MVGRARVIKSYQPQYSDPIQVAAGESLQVGGADSEFPGWRWCTAPDGRSGWVPIELIREDATIVQDYSARELAVEGGEEIFVEDLRHDWVRARNARGDLGWIPASHVQPLVS